MTTQSTTAKLYDEPMPSKRTGPIYNAFSYPTKIDSEAIALFIATHTDVGGTVLDVFGGSGSTGIAASLCDRPTARMIQMAADLGMTPAWGPRRAVVYELSPLGAMLGEVMATPPDPTKFEKAAKSLIERVESGLGWMYDAEDPDGGVGQIRHIIWSETLKTPCCGYVGSLWELAVQSSPVAMKAEFACPTCGKSVATASCPRVTDRVNDSLIGSQVEQRRRTPVKVYGKSPSGTWSRWATDDDLQRYAKAATAPLAFAPKAEIEWGDLYRSGYHTGISHYHHLYTARNLRALSALWDEVKSAPADLQDALRLWILSYNATHSSLLTRVVLKKNQPDFVITGAQSGVLYVSGLPVEKNVFVGLRRKISTFKSAFSMTRGSRSSVTVVCGSSTDLKLEDNSVDYVFTDPPFGDFIPYAEVNQVNEAWLGQFTDRSNEAIISPAQNKGVSEYADLMNKVFAEVGRVLKPSGAATVVFHASKPEVWGALGNAFQVAGLKTERTSVLDKTQVSFKQVVSEGGTRGDALFLLVPGELDQGFESQDVATLVAEIAKDQANSAALSDPKRVYSLYVARCLQTGVPVELSAPQFYAWYKERQAKV